MIDSLLLPDVPTKSSRREEVGRRQRFTLPAPVSNARTIDSLLHDIAARRDQQYVVQPITETVGRVKPKQSSRPSSRSSSGGASDRSSQVSVQSASTYATSNAAHENGKDAYRRNRMERKQDRLTALQTLHLVQQTISVVKAENAPERDPPRPGSAASDHGSSVFSDADDEDEDFDEQLRYYTHASYTGERRYANYV